MLSTLTFGRRRAGGSLLVLATGVLLTAPRAAGADSVLLHAENPARWREATLTCETDYRFDPLGAAFGATSVRFAATPADAVLWQGLPSEASLVRLDADACRQQGGTTSVVYIVDGPVLRAGIAYRLVPWRGSRPETDANRASVSAESAQSRGIVGRWRCETGEWTSFAVFDAGRGMTSLLRAMDDKGLLQSSDCVGSWLEETLGRFSISARCTWRSGAEARSFSVNGTVWLRDPTTLEWRGDDGRVMYCRGAID